MGEIVHLGGARGGVRPENGHGRGVARVAALQQILDVAVVAGEDENGSSEVERAEERVQELLQVLEDFPCHLGVRVVALSEEGRGSSFSIYLPLAVELVRGEENEAPTHKEEPSQ